MVLGARAVYTNVTSRNNSFLTMAGVFAQKIQVSYPIVGQQQRATAIAARA
jgi:hypothetical protein